MDLTGVGVCHPWHIHRHRVFADVAARGKSSVDWFFGFKLHRVVNDEGELLACCLTPGHTDDRQPVQELVEKVWGNLFADKGYISQALFGTLFDQNLQLITKLKRNKLMPLLDKLLSRKRSIIETITDQLKTSIPTLCCYRILSANPYAELTFFALCSMNDIEPDLSDTSP